MNKNTHDTKNIDPEVFGISVAIAGIVGGVAGALQIYDWVTNKIAFRNRRQLQPILQELEDTLKYLEIDMDIILQLSSKSGISNKSFKMGTRMYLTKSDFKRYKNVTNTILGRLKKLIGLTNRLELALVTHKDDVTQARLSDLLEQVSLELESIIRDANLTINDALIRINRTIEQIRNTIKNFRDALE